MQAITPANDSAQSLQVEQQTALERLLAGDSVTAAALAAGVNRATVYRWLQKDSEFQAAWNRGRSEVWDATATRLLKLAPKALAAIERALDAGDVQTGITVLKALGLLKPPKIGSGNAEELREQDMWAGLMKGWSPQELAALGGNQQPSSGRAARRTN